MNVYINGNIYDENYNLQEAMVEDQGTFVFIGTNKEAMKYSGNCIDLKGNYVLPGFNDSHMHLVGYGQSLMNLSLIEYSTSITSILKVLKQKLPKKGWLIGRGWNHDYFTDEKRFITKQDLDSISLDIPIVITRTCGHVLVANSRAIELSNPKGIIEGGSYDIMTGIFKESAMSLIYQAIPIPSKEDIKEYILLAQRKLHSYGITSVQSDDLISLSNNYQEIIDAYKSLQQECKLTMRVYQQAQLVDMPSLKEFIDKGYHTSVGNEQFRIGPLKIIGDGSLGARTAYLSKPYLDDCSTKGMNIYSKQQLKEMISYGHRHQMQIAIHAIGDGILDWILEAYQETLEKYPRINHRHGIVHVQITRKDQLEKIKQLKLHSYIQSIFLDYDIHIVEKRVSQDIASSSYQFKTLLENGSASNGSDCPVETPNICKGIQLAVTRTSIDGQGPYLKQQALTRKQALDSFTINGAYASFEEDIKGKIRPGMLADFVVIDSNILTISVNKIKDIQVLQTYIGGKLVYIKGD